MTTRLYRSQTNRMLGGVCGGLADYLGLDATLIRLFFVLLVLGNGIGVLLYLVLWMLLPSQGRREGATWQSNVEAAASEIGERGRALGDDLRRAAQQGPSQQAGLMIGVALLVAGVFFLLDNLNIAWLRWFDLDVLWPLLLIVGGLVLLFRRARLG